MLKSLGHGPNPIELNAGATRDRKIMGPYELTVIKDDTRGTGTSGEVQGKVMNAAWVVNEFSPLMT